MGSIGERSKQPGFSTVAENEVSGEAQLNRTLEIGISIM